MTTFIVIAVLLTAAALLAMLRPLLARTPGAAQREAARINLDVLRDQLRELDADLAAGTLSLAAHREARAELERRVAQDVPSAPVAAAAAPEAQPRRLVALLLALALPAFGAGLYFHIGQPAALALPAAVEQGGAHQDSPAEIGAMVQVLADRLKDQPNDTEGWYVLARSYVAMNRIEDAALAYAQVARLEPNDPDVLADYADALATTRGGSFDGEPDRLIARALAQQPRHPKALSLAGSAAFVRSDYAQAVAHWNTVLALVPADSEFARATTSSIEEARRRMSGAEGAARTAQPAVQEQAPAAITGTVALAPALQAQVRPTDTVFVYAHAASGSRMPLAIVRATVADLPLAFTLDDSSSMMAAARLSSQEQVVVAARVSRSGSANPAPGDLEGRTGPVPVRAKAVQVTIDFQSK